MWWKFLIPTKANLRIAGIVLGVMGIAVVFFMGYSRGQDRGFDNAYSQFQTDIQQLNEHWYDTVAERDAVVLFDISNKFNQLDQQIKRYVMNDERERELITRLDVLSSTLLEMRNESITTDFGVCEFSPEFDGLLNAARDSISRGATDPTPPSP